MIKQGEDLDEATEEDFYLRRLDAGLFSLQLIDCVIVECCSSGNASVNILLLCYISILWDVWLMFSTFLSRLKTVSRHC